MGWFQKQASCVGKEAFTSPTLAHTVNKRRRKSGKIGAVYRCISCGHYHIGTPVKQQQAMNKYQEKSNHGARR